MMRNLFLLFLFCGLCATACCPFRHLATERRDSIRTVSSVQIVERLVRDTVFVALPDQRERHIVRDTVSRLENDLAASCARINTDGSLYHDLRTKPRLWPAPVDRREITTLRADTVYIDRARRDLVEVPRPLTWWQQMQMRGFRILIAILVGRQVLLRLCKI